MPHPVGGAMSMSLCNDDIEGDTPGLKYSSYYI